MSESGVSGDFVELMKTLLNLSEEESAESVWKYFKYFSLFNQEYTDGVASEKIIKNLNSMSNALKYYKERIRISDSTEYRIEEGEKIYIIRYKGIDYFGDEVFGVRWETKPIEIPNPIPEGGYPGITGTNEQSMALRNWIKYNLLPKKAIDKLKDIKTYHSTIK